MLEVTLTEAEKSKGEGTAKRSVQKHLSAQSKASDAQPQCLGTTWAVLEVNGRMVEGCGFEIEWPVLISRNDSCKRTNVQK